MGPPASGGVRRARHILLHAKPWRLHCKSVSSSLRGRVGRLEPCRTCGHSVIEVRSKLSRTLDVIRLRLPSKQAEALIEELRAIWTHQSRG